MKTVYFVRHAESEANADAGIRTESVAAINLTERGREQAKETAESIPFKADKVIVSKYTRTQQTAAPYIDLHTIDDIEVWDIHEFTYLDQEKYNGTTSEERRSVVEEYWKKADIHYQDAPNSESFNGLIERALKVRSLLLSHPEQKIILYSHGYFIRAFKHINDAIRNGCELTDETKVDLMKRMAPFEGNDTFHIKNASVQEILLVD